MDSKPKSAPPTSDAPSFVQIDEACHRFSKEWHAGSRGRIEEYLEGWEEPERSKLLYELMSIEIDRRRQRGEEPSLVEEESRFEGTRMVVREAFERAQREEDTSPPDEPTLVLESQLSNIRYHAAGGLGVVYAADDKSLNRNMALKFIHRRVAEDEASRERFMLEAEVTSRLEHPGVVPVHGVGTSQDGRPFYAMRFIHGETMDEAIDRYFKESDPPRSRAARELQFRELLDRFVAVCKTIAYAHNRGIVHRDIKPTNIILGSYGQTMVVDWGLALPVERQGIFKESGERTLLPTTGSDSQKMAAGTPAYMSPEQAAGNTDLAPASDIYSLGATLYKVLTGKLPFGPWGCGVGEFPRPRQVNKQTPRPLEAICLKAMAHVPQDRYSTALDLAEDVENYLADVPVTAYRESWGRKVARWTRRHRYLAQALAALLIGTTICGFLASTWLARQAHIQSTLRTTAEEAQRRERTLRTKSLEASAQFAAQMLANQIDIRWRILETEAADPELRSWLQTVNQDPQDVDGWEPIQMWLDQRRAAFPDLESRSWFIQSQSGLQIARTPSHTPSGTPYPSLGRSYAYRDYFHGGGRDYHQEQQFARSPLRDVHNSAAIESTNDGQLTVVFSVPILQNREEVIGVLGMSIALGRFADLEVRLPAGEKLALIETRTYYMLRSAPSEHEERGEGLVLHHQDFDNGRRRESLPHVDDATVRHMKAAAANWSHSAAAGENLLPASYRDPVADDPDQRWLAAFAPVRVSARGVTPKDTGWFVIVQQRIESPQVSGSGG